MKDVRSFGELQNEKELREIREGFLSNIKNLFSSNYEIKNSYFKKMTNEIDCPIGWNETRLKNSIFKLLDEFIATQSKAYADELGKAAEDEDEFSKLLKDNSDDDSDKEDKFGVIKSEKLAQKSNAVLKALDALVKSSKTIKNSEDAANYTKAMYNIAVAASINTALEEVDIDKEYKQQMLDDVNDDIEEFEEEAEEQHEDASEEFQNSIKELANKHSTIKDPATFINEMGNIVKLGNTITTSKPNTRKNNLKDINSKFNNVLASTEDDAATASCFTIAYIEAMTMSDNDTNNRIFDGVEDDIKKNTITVVSQALNAILTACASNEFNNIKNDITDLLSISCEPASIALNTYCSLAGQMAGTLQKSEMYKAMDDAKLSKSKNIKAFGETFKNVVDTISKNIETLQK